MTDVELPLRVVQDRGAAEDVLQEVFVTIWNQSAAAAPGHNLTLAWLCLVTRIRSIDSLRRLKPEQPGGMVVPHQDKLVLNSMQQAARPGQQAETGLDRHVEGAPEPP